MRKIRELNIKNFQSHEDTTINFQDYAIIHGATNSGKSAIIRAIKWCLYNEAPPEGAELTRFGKKETTVSITFDDGRKIIRKRSGKTNEYFTVDENGQENSYTGFGRGPLKEIVEFHGMYMANLFGEAQSVNIVDQQEPPFFLSEGPTARGHLISRLADTLVYEAALIMLKKDAGEIKRNVEDKRNRINVLNNEIDELDYVDDFKSFVDEAQLRKERIKHQTRAFTDIPTYKANIDVSLSHYKNSVGAASILEDVTASQAQIEKLQTEQNTMREISSKIALVNQSIELWNEKKTISDTMTDIEAARKNLNIMANDLTELKRYMQCVENLHEWIDKYSELSSFIHLELKISGVEEPITKIEGSLSDTKTILAESKKIRENIQSFYSAELSATKLCNKIDELTEEYRNKLLEKGVCPTCFNKVDKERLLEVEI